MICSPCELDQRRGTGRQLLYRHFTKPKDYVFPIQTGSPPDSKWGSYWITSDQIAELYAQEPCKNLLAHILSVFFKSVGWFETLFDLYREIEDRTGKCSAIFARPALD